MSREILEFTVCIIGAGPAGLSAAIRLAQLGVPNVCVLEKGASLGAHTLSGAVLEPHTLSELLPDWKERGAPLSQPATSDSFYFLTRKKAWKLPTPPQMKNHGNYIISLGELVVWLGAQAEALGVQIFTGFAAQEAIIEDGHVKGVITGDMGVAKGGAHKANYQAGIEIRAKYTLFAEGARGHVSERVIEQLGLRKTGQFQTYGLGIKEVWEVPKAEAGKIIHTVGWPLDSHTYGGSFIYHKSATQIALGLVVGLDYANPHLDLFEEFQRFKTHPLVAAQLKGGKRIAYGARVLNEGGVQSIPTLSFAGGALIGCAAGFVNVPKIKGIHNAIESGMLAAEAISEAMKVGDDIPQVNVKIRHSRIWRELYKVRNIRPYFHFGLFGGMMLSALDTLLGGRLPFTLQHKKSDHLCLKPLAPRHCEEAMPPKQSRLGRLMRDRLLRAKALAMTPYPAPDGLLTFDRLSSVYLSNTNHEENQPCHLQLKDASVPIAHNLALYDAPEQRYCPAGVYEIRDGALHINAQNCVHCKTCDIKDPTQNIRWIAPEGGGGPNYQGM
jgi:electron-transferring-flavoprotein dehydrogenase